MSVVWTIMEKTSLPNSISMYILLAVVVFESIYEQILKHTQAARR